MKKILLFGRSSLITTFEQEMKIQQPIYDSTVAILKPLKIEITDPEVLTKLALYYTENLGLSSDIKIAKQLDLVGKWDEYAAVKKALESLTHPFEVYTPEGKKNFISDTYYEWADTEELIQEYNSLKAMVDSMEAMQISRSKIKDVLKEWNLSWNPYSSDDLEIPKRFLIEGIEVRKEKAASESMQVQLKRF